MLVCLMGLMTTAALSLQAGEETAWQRRTQEQCKKDAMKDDGATFAGSLSPYAYKQYKNFSEAQKKKAMDYADNNKMSPDDAVAKVTSEM